MGQQTVCACTNYFRAGSEKGHFPKKLFFTVNQTRMFHSLKKWAQPIPKSKLLLFYSSCLRFLEIWGAESTENNTCWEGFSLQFSPYPRVCAWWCGCGAAVSLLGAVLYLALAVVLHRERSHRRAGLSLAAHPALKHSAGWQTSFGRFSPSNVGRFHPQSAPAAERLWLRLTRRYLALSVWLEVGLTDTPGCKPEEQLHLA